MQADKSQSGTARRQSGHLMELMWGAIGRPGSYLLIDSGALVRIPREALGAGNSPLVTLHAKGEVRLAQLSESPNEPVSVLRSIAADNGYMVNF